jgi:hypothetical protein
VSPTILTLAILATSDPVEGGAPSAADAAAVLWDALEELGWCDERVVVLMATKRLGWDPNPRRPDFQQSVQRKKWEARQADARQRALDHTRAWMTLPSADWARAVLAVLLFGDWPARKKGGQPPWAIVRQASARRRLAIKAEARAMADRMRREWAGDVRGRRVDFTIIDEVSQT